nr:thimet oligopeptidase-like [Cherax quadricarinatus]
MKYPHLFPITKKCRVPDTRRLMVTASQSKCMEENTPILEELISLRQKQADLLNYKNHAAYVLEERMANNPENVAQFLSGLAEKLQHLWKQEKSDMLNLKKEECEKCNYEYSGKLDFWDFRYYMNQVEEKMYAVDQNERPNWLIIAVPLLALVSDWKLGVGLEEMQNEANEDHFRMLCRSAKNLKCKKNLISQASEMFVT